MSGPIYLFIFLYLLLDTFVGLLPASVFFGIVFRTWATKTAHYICQKTWSPIRFRFRFQLASDCQHNLQLEKKKGLWYGCWRDGGSCRSSFSVSNCCYLNPFFSPVFILCNCVMWCLNLFWCLYVSYTCFFCEPSVNDGTNGSNTIGGGMKEKNWKMTTKFVRINNERFSSMKIMIRVIQVDCLMQALFNKNLFLMYCLYMNKWMNERIMMMMMMMMWWCWW